jgi:hypothetical protein
MAQQTFHNGYRRLAINETPPNGGTVTNTITTLSAGAELSDIPA